MQGRQFNLESTYFTPQREINVTLVLNVILYSLFYISIQRSFTIFFFFVKTYYFKLYLYLI